MIRSRSPKCFLDDKQDLVNKGTGWMLRAAGDVDRKRLLSFLDRHAAKLPRVLLRYSIEKLDKTQRDHYLNLKKTQAHVNTRKLISEK